MSTDPNAYLDQLRKGLSSGLPDDFVGTIRNVVFRTDPNYQDGQYLACFFDIVDIDNPDIEELQDRRHTIGGVPREGKPATWTWETEDDGRSVIRSDGKPPVINTQSGLGRLGDTLMSQDAFVDAIVQRAAKGIVPLHNQAAFWEGIRGHWKQIEETVDKGRPTERKFTVLLMDEFHEFVDTPGTVAKAAAGAATGAAKAAAKKAVAKKAAGAVKGAAKKAAPARPAARPAPEPEPEVEEAVEEVVEEAAEVDGATPAENAIYDIAYDVLANGDATFDTYMNRCYAEVDGATDDEEIQGWIEDDGDGSLWDQAVKALEAEG